MRIERRKNRGLESRRILACALSMSPEMSEGGPGLTGHALALRGSNLVEHPEVQSVVKAIESVAEWVHRPADPRVE
jgi:hypothetical protein